MDLSLVPSSPSSPSSPAGNVNFSFENERDAEPAARHVRLNVPPRPDSPGSDYSIDTRSDPKGMKMKSMSPRIAIRVEAARKSYGKQSVLSGLYMTVQQGTIYGLLGSSGCGKTTILSCIVGLRELGEGRISIFGKSPGDRDCGVPGRLVGYMPQEVALNEEFTMLEVCQYFGRLYGMDMDKVNERVEYLVNLLDLNDCKGQLSNFSGGQKRRASFVVALLHEPEILILDEPTVGVDPILRAKIWNHIRELTDSNGTTVIITTHYIEEMRQAERVGIMRAGQLMAEASPDNLLAFHDATMLEEVVLKYCLQTNPIEEVAMNTLKPRRGTISFEPEYDSSGRNSMTFTGDQFSPNGANQVGYAVPPPPYLAHKPKTTTQRNRVWALVRKNVTVILRNVGFLLFLLGVPAIIVAFFALAIGKSPHNLGLGFINDETRGSDCAEITQLACSEKELSCAYLDALRSFGTFKLKQYATTEAALAAVEDNSIWGYVHFSNDFSQHFFDRTLGKKLTNSTIHGSKVRVRLDMSNISVGQVIKKLIFEAYRVFTQQLLSVCKVDTTGRDLPVENAHTWVNFFNFNTPQFETPIYGEEDSSYTNFVVPGVVIGFLPFLSCVSCALSYIIEKKDGMLARTKVAGVTAFEVMLSHSIPQFGIIITQTIIAFLIMYACDIPFHIGSPLLACLLTVIASITGMAMGFTGAVVFDEEKNAMLFAMAVIFPSFLLSGLLWPLDGLPRAFRVVSYFLPGTMAGDSLRSILFRGWGITHFAVYTGFLSQFGFIIIFFGLTFLFHKLRN